MNNAQKGLYTSITQHFILKKYNLIRLAVVTGWKDSFIQGSYEEVEQQLLF